MRKLSLLIAAALALCAASPNAHATPAAPPPVEVAAVHPETFAMSDKPIPAASPALYATMLPGLQEVARAHGYALAVHGSMLRDFDLIAVPWTSQAAAPGQLADALRERMGGIFSEYDSNGIGLSKPHGRRCWAIHFGGGCYIDLSVTPRLRDEFETRDGEVFVHLRELDEDAPARPRPFTT